MLNNFLPNYTFILNLDPKQIIARLKSRKNRNKYDKIDLLFHKKVILGYKKISQNRRYINLDASLSKDIIHNNILKILKL